METLIIKYKEQTLQKLKQEKLSMDWYRKITEVPLMTIKQFFGTVIIEPHRNYWIEFK